LLFALTSYTAFAQTQWLATTEPRSPAEEQQLLHVPSGFVIELVAAEPDIAKPLNLNFDQRGRLWVTCTVEYPIAAPPDRKPRDTVKVLEDSDGDGAFDKVTTFADGLNIPIGVLPVIVPGPKGDRLQAAIVHSIPNIYLLVDDDGDGRADRRNVLYGSFGSDDTHGMTGSFSWGFDGWVYAHHGFANTSHVSAADGSNIQMHSGNTFRFRVGGSRVEQYTWGQVNPFGLCFDPMGNLYSADCHTRPANLLLRGACYPSFGKPHDGLGFAPELMTHDHGSTAICGIAYYAANQFPARFRDTLFIGNVVTNRINHDTLERDGSTYKAIERPDFLTSDDPWFRPVDIKLGPDGALYIADFYNRVIAHVEVPLDHPGRDRERGRIWRIYWKGTNGERLLPKLPDFTGMNLQKLIAQLGDPNLTVRALASNELVLCDTNQVRTRLETLLDRDSSSFSRLHAMWVLERLKQLGDEELLGTTKDDDPLVRTHAMRVLSERNEWPSHFSSQVRACLQDPDGFVQRAAADALGRHPSPDNFRALLDCRDELPAFDSMLLHTVRLALREQLRHIENWRELTEKLNETEARAVADVALGIRSAEAANYLLQHLKRYVERPDITAQYVHHIARHGRKELLPDVLAYVRSVRDLVHRATFIRAVVLGTQERGLKISDEVRIYAASHVEELLAADDGESLILGIELASVLKLKAAEEVLTALASRRQLTELQRKSAVSALVSIDPNSHVSLLSAMLADSTEMPPIREHVATLLANLDQTAARDELLKVIPSAPERLQEVIAVGLSGSKSGAESLLQLIVAGKASARLLQLREVEIRLMRHSISDLDSRIAELTADLPPADFRLRQLIEHRRKDFAAAEPDPAAGARVFAKHCGICHQVDNQGAKIGPQLDGIGVRGLERLLEDIIDPNRNVDQAFRSTMFVVNDGKIVSGQILREEGEIIVLANQQGEEVRVPVVDIQERMLSQLSLMPANVAEQLPENDFHDLLAYLLNLRAMDEKPKGRASSDRCAQQVAR